MQLANQEALRFNHEYVGTEHILLGLVKEGSGVAANVLKNLDIDLRKIRQEVEAIVVAGPDVVTVGRLPHTPRAKKVIEYAIEEARSLSHTYVGTEHLLLGLLRERDDVASQVLKNLGAELHIVREETLNLLGVPDPAAPVYPEHDKLKSVKDKSQAIGEFLEWLQHEREPIVCIADTTGWIPVTNEILAEYFEIDLEKLELEKQEMLQEQRKINQGKD